MLLIDAANLGGGGGAVLLKYLLEKLAQRPYHALVSPRTGLKQDANVTLFRAANPLGRKRQWMLERTVATHQPNTLLCFGNLPPRAPVRVNRTVTYFHNPHLIKSLDQGSKYGPKDRLRYYLLRRGIKAFATNTEHWGFQTEFIRRQFQSEYGFPEKNAWVLPFFDDDELKVHCQQHQGIQKTNDFIYVSDDRPHKNHLRLLEAWQLLNSEYGITPRLHLTVPKSNQRIIDRVAELRSQGCEIQNHGILTHGDALELTARCKFVIFPSLLETLGLGLVEGSMLGCKLIMSNVPALADVVQPSATFNPLCADDIAHTVSQAMQANLPDPLLLLQNRIDDLIELVCA